MRHSEDRNREMRKNVLIAVMMTIVVCGIMLMMYFINSRLIHPTHNDGNTFTKEKVSENAKKSVAEKDPSLLDIHSILSSRLGI